MKFIERFSQIASQSVRNKGRDYFLSGRVKINQQTSDHVIASVKGSQNYLVALESWDDMDDAIGCDCDCEYFQSGGICKHIFAVLNCLSEHPRRFNVPGGDFMKEFYSADYDWDGEEEPTQEFGPKSKSATTPAWQNFLGLVNYDADELKAIRYAGTKPVVAKMHEWWYELVVHKDFYNKVEYIKIDVWQRETTKSGKYGKFKLIFPQYASVRSYRGSQDEHQAPTPVDGEIAEFLSTKIGNSHRNHNYVNPDEPLHASVPLAFWQKLSDTKRFFRQTSRYDKPEIETLIPLTADASEWTSVLSLKKDGTKFKMVPALMQTEDQPLIEQYESLPSNLCIYENRLIKLKTSSELSKFPINDFTIPAANIDAFLAGLNQARLPCRLLISPDTGWASQPVKPKPQLIIDSLSEEDVKDEPCKGIQLGFTYGAQHIDFSSDVGIMTNAKEKTYYFRDGAEEDQACRELYALNFVKSRANANCDFIIESNKIIDVIFKLLEKGWDIYAASRKVKTSSSISIKVKSGIDWFEIDRETSTLENASFPEILEAAKRNGSLISVSGDDSYLLIPEEFRRRLNLLLKIGEMKNGNLRFHKNQAFLLESLLNSDEAPNRIELDKVFAGLSQHQQIKKVAASTAFKGTLRSYQQDSLAWFQYLRGINLNGCLADDMGLGKTIQVLAWLQKIAEGRKKNAHPCSLLVVPRSLVHNWQNEIKCFTPNLSCYDLSAAEAKPDFAQLSQEHDLLVITYGMLRQRIDSFLGYEFEYVILDEAQNIKNPKSLSAKAARALKSRHRLALTGTPVENHLGDLWSIFEFLNPGILGKASRFSDWQNQGNIDTLRKALGPLILRRTKEQVLTDLPAKTEQILRCPLEGKQKIIYNEVRDFYKASIGKKIAAEGFGKAKIQVLEALLRLRQAACHPGLIDKKQEVVNSSKLDVLIEHLLELNSIGRKSLVFSQFTNLLALVKKRLDELDIAYEYLDGKTKDREKPVLNFQNDPKKKVFLLSLKAGGVGLNLTAAEYCFILDPWWNPATEAQAVDRAHRIGQDKHVFVYRLICEETVEEKIFELQDKKRGLAKLIMSEDSRLLQALTHKDLEVLLS